LILLSHGIPHLAVEVAEEEAEEEVEVVLVGEVAEVALAAEEALVEEVEDEVSQHK